MDRTTWILLIMMYITLAFIIGMLVGAKLIEESTHNICEELREYKNRLPYSERQPLYVNIDDVLTREELSNET